MRRVFLLTCLFLSFLFVNGEASAQARRSSLNSPFPNPTSAAFILSEQDFTGDGTLDIRLDNGVLWLQINRDPVSAPKGWVEAGGLSGQPSFLRGHIASGGMLDQSVYWNMQSFQVQTIRSGLDEGSYRVVEVDTGNGKEITRIFTVTLQANMAYAWVDYRFRNTGSSSFSYDEYSSHIHDGAHLADLLPSETSDINAYINGVGVINLASQSGWRSYAPDTRLALMGSRFARVLRLLR